MWQGEVPIAAMLGLGEQPMSATLGPEGLILGVTISGMTEPALLLTPMVKRLMP